MKRIKTQAVGASEIELKRTITAIEIIHCAQLLIFIIAFRLCKQPMRYGFLVCTLWTGQPRPGEVKPLSGVTVKNPVLPALRPKHLLSLRESLCPLYGGPHSAY